MREALDINLPEYDTRRRALYHRFRGLGWGAQMSASHDVRKSPSVVSQVLRGRVIDLKILNLLEEWAAGNEQLWRARASDSAAD